MYYSLKIRLVVFDFSPCFSFFILFIFSNQVDFTEARAVRNQVQYPKKALTPEVKIEPLEAEIKSEVKIEPVEAQSDPEGKSELEVKIEPVEVELKPEVKIEPVEDETKPSEDKIKPADDKIEPVDDKIEPVEVKIKPHITHSNKEQRKLIRYIDGIGNLKKEDKERNWFLLKQLKQLKAKYGDSEEVKTSHGYHTLLKKWFSSYLWKGKDRRMSKIRIGPKKRYSLPKFPLLLKEKVTSIEKLRVNQSDEMR